MAFDFKTLTVCLTESQYRYFAATPCTSPKESLTVRMFNKNNTMSSGTILL